MINVKISDIKEERKNLIGSFTNIVEKLVIEYFKSKDFRIILPDDKEIDVSENDVQYIFNNDGLEFLKRNILNFQFKYFYTIPKIISLNTEIVDNYIPIDYTSFNGIIDLNEDNKISKENIILVYKDDINEIFINLLPFTQKIFELTEDKKDGIFTIKTIEDYKSIIPKVKYLICNKKSFDCNILINDITKTGGKVISIDDFIQKIKYTYCPL